ncbi:MAG: OmpP1/FadL family transporter [Myxococcota bacterium]
MVSAKITKSLNLFNIIAFVVLLNLFLPHLAEANPVDLFGAGSKSAAMADTGVASTDQADALFLNPARLSFTPKLSIMGGLLFQQAALQTPAGNRSIRDSWYSHFGISFPSPFKGFLEDKIQFGFFAVAPLAEMTRIEMRLPSDPAYPYFENRSQRLVLIPGFSYILFDSPTAGKLSFGVGVNYFAALEGAIIGREGATRSVEARVFEEIQGKTTVNGGIAYNYKSLHFGFSYRQAFGLDFHNVSFNHIAGTDINLDLKGKALYSPHTLSWGMVWKQPKYSIQFNLIEYLWSFYSTPLVSMRSQLPLVGSLVGELPETKFNNTMAFLIGGSYKLNGKFILRGGVGFENKMLPEQTGKTNLLDTHKLKLTMGLTWKLSTRLFLHGHLRYIHLLGSTHRKNILTTDADCGTSIPASSSTVLSDEVHCVPDDESTWGFQTTNPGYPSISSGGGVFAAGITLEVRQ